MNSNYTKKAFADKYPHLNSRAEVISNPLLDIVEVTERSLNEQLKIGTIGRLAHIKGNDLFISSLPKVIEKFKNISIEIYGDGEEKDNLEELTQTLKIKSNVSFKGFTKKSIDKMRTFDCLVVPSRKESFGLVALESLAVGTPVVAFKETGVSDFLESGTHGYLTDVEDLDQMSENIIKVLSESEKWQQLSQAGITMVQEKYSLEKHVNSLKECYLT